MFQDSVNQLMSQERVRATAAYGVLSDGNTAPKILKVYRRIEDLMNQSTVTIDCKQGCHYCCNYHIYVTPIEIFSIVEEISKLPLDQINAIEQSISGYVEQVKGMGAEKHIRTNIPCSFLKDGACSIYSIRPLACRRHHSLDVGGCRRAHYDVNLDEPVPRDTDRVIVSTAMETLHKVIHFLTGFDVDSYEFHAAMHEALTNKASFKRWKGGKIAFPSVVDKVRFVDEIKDLVFLK